MIVSRYLRTHQQGQIMQPTCTYQSPIGKLAITSEDEQLLGINYTNTQSNIKPNNAFDREVIRQLKAYFKQADFQFNLPIKLDVTDHHLKVLKALQRIPMGNVKTYGELAEQIHSGPRAIGNACRRNPISIIIPCHRVVAKSHLGGYSGKTSGKLLDKKIWLLQHENYM